MANEQDQSRFGSASPNIPERERPSPDSGGGHFEIHIRGHLDSKWSDWLEGLEMKLLDNGEMVLHGPIVDQAALMGILNKLSRLNLTLLAVNKAKKRERSEEQ